MFPDVPDEVYSATSPHTGELRSCDGLADTDSSIPGLARWLEGQPLDLRVQRAALGGLFDEGLRAVPASEGLESHNYIDSDGLKAALARCFNVLGLSTQEAGTTVFDVSDNAFEQAKKDHDISEKARTDQFYYEKPLKETLAPNSPSAATMALQQVVWQCEGLDFWGCRLKDFFKAPSVSEPQMRKRPVLITDYFKSSSSTSSQSQRSRKSPTVLRSTDGCLYGRLFTTCFGLVGAAQCHMRPGDKIYYLPGCNMPVVLRPSRRQNDGYELLGGVYLDGLMVPDLRPVLRSSASEMVEVTIV